ncbi:MAG: hypothetical protein JXB36_00035 [Gammaproteobacteria bacterium]|nr:hypothetical protein [Gammaproteobacteria bacterium]
MRERAPSRPLIDGYVDPWDRVPGAAAIADRIEALPFPRLPGVERITGIHFRGTAVVGCRIEVLPLPHLPRVEGIARIRFGGAAAGGGIEVLPFRCLPCTEGIAGVHSGASADIRFLYTASRSVRATIAIQIAIQSPIALRRGRCLIDEFIGQFLEVGSTRRHRDRRQPRGGYSAGKKLSQAAWRYWCNHGSSHQMYRQKDCSYARECRYSKRTTAAFLEETRKQRTPSE